MVEITLYTYIVFGAAIWNRDNLANVLHTLSIIENEFNLERKTNLTREACTYGISNSRVLIDRNNNVISLVILNFFFVLLSIHDFLFFEALDEGFYYWGFFFEYYQIYSIVLHMLIVVNLILHVKSKFNTITDFPLQIGQYIEHPKIPEPINTTTFKELLKVPIEYFLTLCEIVCMINTAFGWSFLIFILLVLLGLLNASTTAIVYGYMSIATITSSILWNVFFLVRTLLKSIRLDLESF